MKRLLEVCLFALAFPTNLAPSAAAQSSPPMREGISVEMPVTSNAVPMPDADQEDALIVTVTGNGSLYLGVSPADLNALRTKLQEILSANKKEKKLYIKADAHAPYASVMKVLDAATAAGIERTVLLTKQRDSPEPGTVVPPNGFTIVTGECKAMARPRLSL